MENNAQNTGYHPERNTQPHSILSIPSSGKLGLRVFSVQESGCAEIVQWVQERCFRSVCHGSGQREQPVYVGFQLGAPHRRSG